MPGLDGTGPYGLGTMTGRRMGFCAPVNPYHNYSAGRAIGFGRGMGLRRGRGSVSFGPGFGRGLCFWLGTGWGFRAVELDPAAEKNYLQNMAAYLQDELNAVKEELSKLEEKTQDKE